MKEKNPFTSIKSDLNSLQKLDLPEDLQLKLANLLSEVNCKEQEYIQKNKLAKIDKTIVRIKNIVDILNVILSDIVAFLKDTI